MPYLKKIIVSGSVFSGWSHTIDLDKMESIEDIITETKYNIKTWISVIESATNQDLYGLRQACGELDLHIHDYSFNDLLLDESSNIYVCLVSHNLV